MIHTMIDVKREGGRVFAKTACGQARTAKSQAELYVDLTAWAVLTTCPECRERVGLEPVEDVKACA